MSRTDLYGVVECHDFPKITPRDRLIHILTLTEDIKNSLAKIRDRFEESKQELQAVRDQSTESFYTSRLIGTVRSRIDGIDIEYKKIEEIEYDIREQLEGE